MRGNLPHTVERTAKADDTVVLPSLVRAAFSALDTHGIPYVVLRGFQPLEKLATSTDIDLFIPESHIGQAMQILHAVGWRLRRFQVGRYPHLFFDAWGNAAGLVCSLDVVTSLCFGKRILRLANDDRVLESARMVQGVRIPAPWHAAFCFALHVLLDKGFISAANAQRATLMRERMVDALAERDEFQDVFGAAAVELTEKFYSEELSSSPDLFLRLKQVAESLPMLSEHTLLAISHRLRTRISQLLRPVARIAMFGIDGSGKSTLVQMLSEHGGTIVVHSGYLGNNAFRTWPALWLTASLQSMRSSGQTTGLRLRILANLDSLWRPIELAVRMMIAEHRAEIVLYDRFPIGQDDGAPSTLWGRVVLGYTRATRKMLPQPDLVILLDGDDHTIWSRKKEMPFEVHVRTQSNYRALIRSLKVETATVRTDGTLDESFQQLRNTIAASRAVAKKLYGSGIPRTID